MAHITLDLTSARLVAGFGNSEIRCDPRWRIILDAKPQWPTRLKLGTGEEIGWLAQPDQIAMRVNFMEGDEADIAWAKERTRALKVTDWEEDATPVGVMRFLPSTVNFDIYTPHDVHASMVRFAESGRYLKEVTFDVLGLNYDSRPDGSGLEWPENEKVRILPVVGVTYVLPLVQESRDEPEPGAPKTLVGADLTPILKDILTWVKNAVWVLFGMGLLAIILKGRG